MRLEDAEADTRHVEEGAARAALGREQGVAGAAATFERFADVVGRELWTGS